MFPARLLLRFLLPVLLLGFTALPVVAGEEEPESEQPRVWTSVDGRKLTGTLEEKGEDWVKLRIKDITFRAKSFNIFIFQKALNF